MDDYISREAAILAVIKETVVYRDGPQMIPHYLAYKALCEVPPADVRPVVRGEWENMNDDLDFHFRCSRCGEETWQTVMGKPRFKYCPMCGADMRGGGT